MAKKEYKIPFFGNQMLSYVDKWMEDRDGFEWRDNYSFESKMTIEDYGRGRSAVTIYLLDELNNRYEVFISDFIEMMKKLEVSEGSFYGKFTFCKKGKNYGLQLWKN